MNERIYGKNSDKIRFEIRIRVKGSTKRERRSISFTRTKQIKEDCQHIRNALRDIEESGKNNTGLTAETEAWIRKLRQTFPEMYKRMEDEQWFHIRKEMTLNDAFNEYIAEIPDRGTRNNWTNTAGRIYRAIDPSTLVTDVTLKQVKKGFNTLRNKLKKTNGEPYSVATLDKDAKNLRQLFRELDDNGDIPKNPISDQKFKFKIPKHQKPKPKPTKTQEEILAVLSQIDQEKNLQQYTLFAYYRLMSARQSDPKYDPKKGNVGDHWEDVDFERKCINRWNCKSKSRQGWFPCNDFMWQVLMKWHEAVVAEHGKAEGPIFPWLNEVSDYYQRKFYYKKIDAAFGKDAHKTWRGVSQTLRCNRSRELRRMKNGEFMESRLVGHSKDVADEHYDDIQAAEDFPQIWDEEKWNLDEGEAA